ncbi:MAG: hypothetical protein HYR90_02120 [Candidatus Andersenbacteria bacterium]|nr:hypothetical protein [Candidatus Andersenbacteria bacterium]MBI3250957.1 hypothetical protein [Candidatus Andersenbacteria bacterium]
MKDLINLMPPAAKQRRVRYLYIKRAKALYTTLLLVLIIIGAGYGVVCGVFWQASRDASAQLSLDSSKTSNATQQTEQINTLLKEAKERLYDQRPWLPDVAAALKLVPAEVTITAVEIAPVEIAVEDKVIAISGQSNSRSATLQFQKNLEGLPWVKTVEAPLQNFASGPDVSFRFTLTRKP